MWPYKHVASVVSTTHMTILKNLTNEVIHVHNSIIISHNFSHQLILLISSEIEHFPVQSFRHYGPTLNIGISSICRCLTKNLQALFPTNIDKYCAPFIMSRILQRKNVGPAAFNDAITDSGKQYQEWADDRIIIATTCLCTPNFFNNLLMTRKGHSCCENGQAVDKWQKTGGKKRGILVTLL